MSSYLKDPDEVESYLIDFTSRLVSGEVIESVQAAAPPDTVLVAPDGHPTTFTDKTVTVWVAGGTDGAKVNVVARITTSQGRIKEQAIRLRIFSRGGGFTFPTGGVIATTVTDLGDGTATISGSAVSDSGTGTFTLTGATDNGDGTYLIAA